MKTKILLLATILSPVLTLQAIVDSNENGLSDIWETQHNNDELFPETFDPEADPDADGWTNAQEAAAGTDPFSTAHPEGHLQPETTHIPATWGDTDYDNVPDLITPEVIRVSWPTIPGKQYTLQSNPDLESDNWINVGSQFIGAGTFVTYNFVTSAAAKTFWRVSVTDVDSDEDQASDAEEQMLGTNPMLADTDEDGMTDGWELRYGLDPLVGSDGAIDSDGDGLENLIEFNQERNPIVHDVITQVECDGEAVGSNVVQTIASGTHSWEGQWSDGSAASGHAAHEEFQQVLARIDGQPYDNDWRVCLVEPESNLKNDGLIWFHPDGPHASNRSFDTVIAGPDDSSIRVTAHQASKHRIRLTRNIDAGPAVTHRFISLVFPNADLLETPNASVIDMTIAENQKHSPVVEIKSNLPSSALLCLLPVKITAAFGNGPGIEVDGQHVTSRMNLEQVFSPKKIVQAGDTWVIRESNRLWAIRLVADENSLIQALSTPAQTVIFDGHANFGLGPNFSSETNHKTIASFTNFGTMGATAIPTDYRGNGTEPDVLPYMDGEPLPQDPPELAGYLEAGIDNMKHEGWAWLVLGPDEIKGEVTNQPIPIMKRRWKFEKSHGVSAGTQFSAPDSGMTGYHYLTPQGSRLIVSAPDSDLPPVLRYKTFFYNACSSGPHFINNFKHGEFIYTNRPCRGFEATAIFIQGIMKGMSTKSILNQMEELDADGDDENITYEVKSF